jgi:hypothetical protein
MHGFAIVPDETKQTAAVFTDLEDAMEWGVQRYGNDRFTIRYFEGMAVQRDDRRARD